MNFKLIDGNAINQKGDKMKSLNNAQKAPGILLAVIFLTACSHPTDSPGGYTSVPPAPKTATYKSPTTQVSIQDQTPDKIKIQSNDPSLDGQELDKGADKCFHKANAGDLTDLTLCRSSKQISVSAKKKNSIQKTKKPAPAQVAQAPSPTPDPVSEIHIVASKTPDVGVTLEEPKVYSLDELRDLTQKQNFQLREELDNLKAAKANMQMHYANLLPHLSMNSILAAATSLGPLSILAVAGDLVPFLLPNRWAQANEAKHIYKAEQYSEQIARQDAIQMIESLAFSVMRDQDAYTKLVSLRPKYLAVVKLVQDLQTSGKLAAGRERDSESPLNLLDQAISSLQNVVNADLVELAAAVGFNNPLAITAITGSDFADITLPHSEDLSALEQNTIQSSQEIQQMSEIVAAASANEEERHFDWLDPAGDPQGGIGAGLPSFIEIGKVTVDELKIETQRVQSDLLKKIVEAAQNYNMNFQSYSLASDGADLQAKRYDQAILEITQNPNDTPIGDLNDTLTQWPVQHVNIVTAKYGWFSSISQINRLAHRANFAATGTK